MKKKKSPTTSQIRAVLCCAFLRPRPLIRYDLAREKKGQTEGEGRLRFYSPCCIGEVAMRAGSLQPGGRTGQDETRRNAQGSSSLHYPPPIPSHARLSSARKEGRKEGRKKGRKKTDNKDDDDDVNTTLPTLHLARLNPTQPSSLDHLHSIPSHPNALEIPDQKKRKKKTPISVCMQPPPHNPSLHPLKAPPQRASHSDSTSYAHSQSCYSSAPACCCDSSPSPSPYPQS